MACLVTFIYHSHCTIAVCKVWDAFVWQVPLDQQVYKIQKWCFFPINGQGTYISIILVSHRFLFLSSSSFKGSDTMCFNDQERLRYNYNCSSSPSKIIKFGRWVRQLESAPWSLWTYPCLWFFLLWRLDDLLYFNTFGLWPQSFPL